MLNRGKRIAILAGQGALGARDELIEIAELLGAPIVKALLGKGVVPDDHPLTTGGIGLLGTRASQEAFEECDTLLIVGSTFPYVEYYPKPAPGARRADRPRRLAHRPALSRGSRTGRRCAQDAQGAHRARSRRMATAASSSAASAASRSGRRCCSARWTTARGRLTPGRLARELGTRLRDDAIVAWDSGHNTGVLARYIERARHARCSPAPACWRPWPVRLPYAIAAALAFPGRQVVAFVGDGGLTMLFGELATDRALPTAHQDRGHEEQHAGPDQVGAAHVPRQSRIRMRAQPIDFAAVAQGFGVQGFRATTDKDLEAGLDALFAASGPALVEALVDPNEPLLPPKRMPKYAENLEKALNRGTPGAEEIRAALEREPAHTQLSCAAADHSSLRLMSDRNSRRNAPSLRNTPRITLLVIFDALSFTPRQCMQK